ncbi:unnamed protein product [Paramecium sonneborni]|uniref:Uncharacterized protein n=1 Tax=Paramecium sonneborni TaxID=65129 RepID=A0A8S1RAY6_9CILI|nr:unnamed protein product [Paramecium sonneborni]
MHQPLQQEHKSLIQYYIYQDFQNLVNLLYSMMAIKNYFVKQTDHPMIPIGRNKVILQLNLSNSIHYDLQRTYQSEKAKEFIYEERGKVKRMIGGLNQELGIELQQFINDYQKNSLNKEVGVFQIPSNMQQQRSQGQNFNQNNLDKFLDQFLNQLEVIDKQVSKIQTTKYYMVPNIDEIRKKALGFYILTLTQLQKNFPGQIQTNGYQDNFHPDMKSNQKKDKS